MHFNQNIFQFWLVFLHDTVTFHRFLFCSGILNGFIYPCPSAIGIPSGYTQHIGGHRGIICFILCSIFFHSIYMNRCSLYNQMSNGILHVFCRVEYSSSIVAADTIINCSTVSIHLNIGLCLPQFSCGNRILIVCLRKCIPQQVVTRRQIRQNKVSLIAVIIAFCGICNWPVKCILISSWIVIYIGQVRTGFLIPNDVTWTFRIGVGFRFWIRCNGIAVYINRIALCCQ